jgi:hypothetical protein
MKDITTVTTVYKFNELPEDIQDKVLENLYDINIDFDWWDGDLDEWKGKLKESGFDNGDINFSVFHSQGDGASFTADLKTILESRKDKYPVLYKYWMNDEIDLYGDVTRTDSRNGHKFTAKTRLDYDLCIDEDEYPDGFDLDTLYDTLRAQADNLEDEIEDLRQSLCEDIYSELSKEYDYLTSREAIIETIEANDYDFTEDGKIF